MDFHIFRLMGSDVAVCLIDNTHAFCRYLFRVLFFFCSSEQSKVFFLLLLLRFVAEFNGINVKRLTAVSVIVRKHMRSKQLYPWNYGI